MKSRIDYASRNAWFRAIVSCGRFPIEISNGFSGILYLPPWHSSGSYTDFEKIYVFIRVLKFYTSLYGFYQASSLQHDSGSCLSIQKKKLSLRGNAAPISLSKPARIDANDGIKNLPLRHKTETAVITSYSGNFYQKPANYCDILLDTV